MNIRHVVVRGRVQGVGFAPSSRMRRCALGLEGWVRNRRDGTVEAVFAGPTRRSPTTIAACRTDRAARVSKALTWPKASAIVAQPPRRALFAVLPTA